MNCRLFRTKSWSHVLAALLVMLNVLVGQSWHPADTNQDNAIVLDEIGPYHASIRDSSNLFWQQAQFIWSEGGRYETNDALAEPFRWFPEADGAVQYVSLDQRQAYPFDPIQVIGLPSRATVSAEYQVEGSDAWIALEAIEDVPSGSFGFHMPYIPSPWLESRWLKIRLMSGGDLYQAGRVWLREIDRRAYPLAQLFDDLQVRLERYLSDPVDVLVQKVTANEPIATADRQLLYYHLYAEALKQTFKEIRRTPHPDTEIGLIITEELHALDAASDAGLALANLADQARAQAAAEAQLAAQGIAAQTFAKCERIRDWGDLILKTKERLKLELADGDMSLKKQLTDKAISKLPDLADKLGKQLVEKGSFLAKRAALPVNLTLQFREFINEWSKAMLPKTFTNLRFEFRDHRNQVATQLLEDSPYTSGQCPSISIHKTFATIQSDGFSGAKFLLDSKIPKPDDLRLFGADGVASTLDGVRQKAIDKVYDEIKDFDLMASPCVWKDIEVPQTRDDPKFDLRSLTDVLTIDASIAAGFLASRVGNGTIEVKLRTSGTPEPTDNLPATKTYTQTFSFPVVPIQIIPEKYALSVTDLRRKIDLKARLVDSWEHEQLSWMIYDKDGVILEERVTDLSEKLSDTSARHIFQQFDPPDDFRRYPLGVRMESKAKGCIAGKPPRRETATIHYNKKAFDVSPNHECFAEGSEVTLTATPFESLPDFRVKTWEIVSGEATITPLDDVMASVQLPDTPEAEIVVRATGDDDFEGFAYLSTGPCIDWANATFYFIDQPLIPGQRIQSDISVLTVGYDGYDPQFVPGLAGLPGGTVPEAVPAVFAMGKADLFVGKQTPIDDNLSEFEVAFDGAFIAFFDPVTITADDPIDPDVSALHTGTYFDEFDPERSPFHFMPGWAAYDRVSDFMKVTDDNYTVPVSIELNVSDSGLNFSNVSVSWSSSNGSIGQQTETVEEGSRLSTVEIDFDRPEIYPTYTLTLSGTVTDKVGDDVKSYSLSSHTTVRLHKIELGGLSNFKMDARPDEVTLCANSTEGFPPELQTLVLDGCCGELELDGYPKTRGSARQNLVFSGTVPADELGDLLRFVSISVSQDGGYCHEVIKRKKDKEEGLIPCEPEEMDDPDNPDPDPDHPDPDEPTPPELADSFDKSPSNLDGKASFPKASPGSSVSSGGASFAQGFQYPYSLPISQEIYMGYFSASGIWQRGELLLDGAAADLLGGDVRVVSYASITNTARRGLLIQRSVGDRGYLDFWEIDPATDKFIARNLLVLDPEIAILGMGEFNGDAFPDYLGVREDQSTVLYPGTAADAGPLEEFLPAQGTFAMRSLSRLPNGTSILAAEDPLGLQNRLFVIDTSGSVSRTTDIDKPNFFEVPRAFADFNSDGVPDLVTAGAFLPMATVTYLNNDGSVGAGTLILSSLPFGAELPGAPTF